MNVYKDLKRALRRHHMARLKKVRATYWGHIGPTPPFTPVQLGIIVHTPQVCSCMGCGNQRRWEQKGTMQEQRWYQHAIDELLDDTDV